MNVATTTHTHRCSCGCLIEFYPTGLSGRPLPIETDSRHTTYREGDWTIGEDGRVRPGMPMFDTLYVRPHWEGCPDAERYRQREEG